MNDGEWEGDDALPPAPVPRHEREWRHPSELGRPELATFETRTTSKGALVLAGLTGVAMTLVLGRLLIPSGGGGDQASGTSASTSAATRAVASTLALATSALPTSVSRSIPVTPDSTRPTDVASTDPQRLPNNPPDVAPSDVDPPTTPIEVTVTAGNSPPKAVPPIAIVTIGGSDRAGVLWNAGQYVMTTDGVGELGTIQSVTLATGSSVEAVVVAKASGLAMLELNEPAASVELPTAWPPVGSVQYTEAGGTTTAISVTVDDAGTYVLNGQAMREGAPVVDDQGRFVGLCGRGESDSHIVSWVPADKLIAQAAELGAWLGVRSGASAGGPATIAEIAEGAPAETAGIRVGDVVTAIDSHPVRSLRELGARLRVIRPGATVTLTVLREGQTVTVTATTTTRPKNVGPTTTEVANPATANPTTSNSAATNPSDPVTSTTVVSGSAPTSQVPTATTSPVTSTTDD